MSLIALPSEVQHMIIAYVSGFENSQSLEALALTSSYFLPYVHPVLFRNISFHATKAPPRIFLVLVKARPTLPLLVKSVTLTQSVVQQKATIRVLRQLHNVDRLVFPAGHCSLDEFNPKFHYADRWKWPWTRPHSDPCIAASLATIGQRLPKLRDLVLRDVETFPLDLTLESIPHLHHLELAWIKPPADVADINHNLKSIQWNIEGTSLVPFPASTWLLGPSLTHLHLTIRTSHFSSRHQPSCRLLTSLQSLTYEIQHGHYSYLDVAETAIPFFLQNLQTVPITAPLTILTLVIRELHGYERNWYVGADWGGLVEGIAKLGALVVKRHLPVKKIHVRMLGFITHRKEIRNALAIVEPAIEVMVEINRDGHA
ncbi:hypothetical protein DL96DRAFT_1627967 [Flagelloscypha sp. PMI_526]|nr:hypothetical protein DL96DRAFT_1627967 [Flagelloscypha sp. PMI_526]